MPDGGYAVAVCGFGRCGSTMTMQMLVAGGLPPGNATDPPYEGDPKALVGRDLTGTCIKMLDRYVIAAVLAGPTPAWRFIWLDRAPLEQARSYQKFVAALAPVTGINPAAFTPQQLANTFARDRPAYLAQLREAGPVLVLDYERVLAHPRRAADRIRRAVWPGLDPQAAAAVVHQRDGRCRPDLSVELNHPRPLPIPDPTILRSRP